MGWRFRRVMRRGVYEYVCLGRLRSVDGREDNSHWLFVCNLACPPNTVMQLASQRSLSG